MSYSDLKVNELRQILKDRGIPSTGLTRKAQIVEELERDDAAKAGTNDAPEEQSGTGDRIAEEGDGKGEEHGTPVEAPAPQDANSVETNPADKVTAQGQEESFNEEPAPLAVDAPELSEKSEGKIAREQSLAQEDDANVHTELRSDIASESGDAPPEPVAEEAAPELSDTEPAATGIEDAGAVGDSATPEAVPTDSRKRKRRSKTPPPTEESVNKKLKAAGDPAPELAENLKEDKMDQSLDDEQDAIIEDAPAPVSSEDHAETHDTAIPASTSDDVRYADHARAVTQEDVVMNDEHDAGVDVPPATHPATRTLYIRNLLRPIQKPSLQSHLVTLLTPPNSSSDPTLLEELHLDPLKTHAFARFASISAASRVRSRLHGRIWPDEGTRRPLEVDFIPENKMSEWVEIEEREGGRRGDSKRWEVVYEHNQDDDVIAELREVLPASFNRQGSNFGGRQPSFQSVPQGTGMPGAPLGPRGDSRKHSAPGPPSGPSGYNRAPTKPVAKTAAFLDLDSRFPSTEAKPKIYFLPVDKELANRRLDAFDAATSRDWDGNTESGGQPRRYTFEDGDVIVDGGADFGHFGRDKVGGDRFRPGGRRGGRGR